MNIVVITYIICRNDFLFTVSFSCNNTCTMQKLCKKLQCRNATVRLPTGYKSLIRAYDESFSAYIRTKSIGFLKVFNLSIYGFILLSITAKFS